MLMPLKDGGRLACERRGDGPAVVLVTGFMGAAAFWDPGIDLLADRCSTTRYDHRGTGLSSPSLHGSIREAQDDLLELLDACEIAAAHVVGHSMGGVIAQALALDQPERVKSLVLASSWAHSDAYFEQVFALRWDQLQLRGWVPYMQATQLFLYPPAYIAEHASDLAEEARTSVSPGDAFVRQRIDAVVGFDRTAELDRVSVPTLVLSSRDDAMTPPHMARDLAAAIRGARLTMLDGGGHYLPRTRPAQFAEHVLQFIDQQEGKR